MFTLTVYMLTVAPLLLTMLSSMSKWQIWFLICNMLAYCAIILTLGFAILKIRQYTRMLPANQVFMNERLAGFHLFCFTMLCATRIASTAFQIGLENVLLDTASDNQKRHALISIAFSTLSMPFCSLTTTTMLVMFVRGSRPIEKSGTRSIKRQFLLAFSNTDDLKALDK